jgi:hypothetical protein
MFKVLSLLIYSFLTGLCFFQINVVQALDYEPPYYAIERESKTTGVKLGAAIDSHPNYKKPILKNCLQSVTRPTNGVIANPSTPQEIIQFFEDQDLVRHVEAPEYNQDGHIRTFNHTYGLEFSEHGPVEEKVIELIQSLTAQGKVAFLDIGAGYGAFAKRVIEACEGDLEVYVNECLSIQCYHAAKLLEGWKQVRFYPRDILSDLRYNRMDRSFHISTIFNVHHFMKISDFEDSLKNAYDMTVDGGYHIAVALSPYHMGDDSDLAKHHDELKKEEGNDYPGYFTESGLFKVQLPLRAYAHFPSREVYERAFQKAGFFVEECGYFSLKKDCPREFTYIIGKKNKG